MNDSYLKGPVPIGLFKSKPTGTTKKSYEARMSASGENGVKHGISIVSLSIFFALAMSRAFSEIAPSAGLLGFTIRWKLNSTSSALSVLPLWNSTSGFTRIVHFMASLLASSSSARLSTGWASRSKSTKGLNREYTRAPSTRLTQFCGSSVSELLPPLKPACSVPPRLMRGDIAAAALDLVVLRLPVATRPPVPRKAAPCAA